MTNHNPAFVGDASPLEDRANSHKLNSDILAKVNAHADRSMDRLFADIEELLNSDSDDIEDRASGRSTPEDRQQAALPYPASSEFSQPQLSATTVESDAPQSPQNQTFPAPKQKKRLPLWLKACLGIGTATAVIGGGLVWLVNERKIELPKNINTSWLPFQSQSPSAVKDAKFAEYMRKSLANIEAAAKTPTPAAAVPINPAATEATTTAPSAAVAIAPTPTTSTIVANTAAAPVKAKIGLLKTNTTAKQPNAMFEIDRQSKMVNIGQQIGSSDWKLLTVAKNEVLIKRKGGEIRSVYVGQKF